MSNSNQQFDKSSFQTEEGSWWTRMLSRRKLLRNTAIGVGIVGLVYACSDDDEESEAQSLELQRQEGWNVGSTDRKLALTNSQQLDSKYSTVWKNFTQAPTLVQAYQPTEAASQWKPYFVPTLLQSLGQETLKNVMQPVFSPAMAEAYSRGLGMKAVLTESQDAATTLLVVDIPGAEAVAFAAALADVVQPILTFDNWPHPLGVAQSQQTLGALLYYAQEMVEKNTTRPAKAPALLVLDSNRLAPYSDADSQFDNRYMAKLPTEENLKTLNITNILYAVPNEAQTKELDDLNEEFALYADKGINVSLLPLSRFQPPSEQASSNTASSTTASITTASSLSASSQTASSTATASALNAGVQKPQSVQTTAPQQPSYGGGYPVYYYGGGPMFSPWFFYHYSMYSYARALPPVSRMPSSSFTTNYTSRPSYRAVRRPTLFSSSMVGGKAAGVGRQRPTGFGFVGVRRSSSGSLSGIRAGRSGSFGGSRSGSFGRSFGGRSS
jgi:hypothetical protein